MFNQTNHFLNYILILFLITVVSNKSYAEDQLDAPSKIPGVTKIFAEDVFDLHEKTPGLLIIDARITGDRKHGYIEGSVNLPDIETNCDTLAKIIPEKNTPILFYCNGVKCGRSVNSSKIALKCGYTKIYWFRGGFEEWKLKNMPFLKS